jgi:hypothetical protein
MFESIKNFFRRRAVRKYSKAVPTGILPLSDISSANIVIDVEEAEWDVLKDDILAWGRASGVKVAIYFFDFRKLGKNELLLTSIQTTVARKDLNWFGMPSYEKVSGLINEPCDLFISLVDTSDFAVDFVSRCSAAKFKIGRRAYPGHCFDLLLSGKQSEGLRSGSCQVFAGIVEFARSPSSGNKERVDRLTLNLSL